MSAVFVHHGRADHSGTGDGAGQIRSDRAVEYGADPWCGMVQRTLQDGSGSDPHSRDHCGCWHRMEQYETAGDVGGFYPNM